MAILKTVQTGFGIEIKDAHHRVENVSLIAKDKMTFQVRARVSSEQQMIFYEAAFQCRYDINGDNPIAQAYVHLKSLPEFADAVDC